MEPTLQDGLDAIQRIERMGGPPLRYTEKYIRASAVVYRELGTRHQGDDLGVIPILAIVGYGAIVGALGFLGWLAVDMEKAIVKTGSDTMMRVSHQITDTTRWLFYGAAAWGLWQLWKPKRRSA